MSRGGEDKEVVEEQESKGRQVGRANKRGKELMEINVEWS